MAGFTKQSLLAWLARERGERIVLKARASSLYLAGVCEDVEELDACSTEFTSCHVRLRAPGAELSLTLHDTALALHALLRDPQSGGTALSLPMTLSYADVILEREADSRESAEEERRRLESLRATPYRLLH
jgi:hypothetical protein